MNLGFYTFTKEGYDGWEPRFPINNHNVLNRKGRRGYDGGEPRLPIIRKEGEQCRLLDVSPVTQEGV